MKDLTLYYPDDYQPIFFNCSIKHIFLFYELWEEETIQTEEEEDDNL